MKSVLVAVSAVMSAVLVGCGRTPEPVKPHATVANDPGSLLSSPKLLISSRGSAPSAIADTRVEAVGTPDPAVPIERYSDLNALPQGVALSFVVTAKSKDPMSDEERLHLLSPSYHSEPDVFKRQELAKAELPRVNTTLEQYRKQAYYALPIAADGSQPLALRNLMLGPYEVASKSFPLFGYGGRCWSSEVIRNVQGAVLQLGADGPPCRIIVDNEAAARAIEAARANHTLLLGGTAYVFIPRAEKGVATGVVARVHLVLT
ncbi:MAG TPA: hypothetical protein VFP68_01485, partial [Burkholderiaceae bacterium]|nr:hypothetical protein [Burkholderiaceae bacterium]